MKLLKTSALISLLIFGAACYSQKEANIWYFGGNAGLDFNGNTPTAITDSKMHTWEGCASIADKNGQLLFYTDGSEIWNKNHQTMTNGAGLLGDSSSTQSAIIVPKPGSNDIYYVFTVVDKGKVEGLNYSEINMSLSGGLGAVTQNKNILLLTPTCEKITAVLHENGSDIWVISHKWNSDAFYSYLVTQNGVSQNPVISNTGILINGIASNTIGYLKASPDGKKVALANFSQNNYKVEVCDFDNSNGIISNGFVINSSNLNLPYGVEFSPLSQYLYISERDIYTHNSKLYQYDLLANDVSGSEVILDTISAIGGALQLGPDGKIYLAIQDSYYLYKINKPDKKGKETKT